MLYSMKHTERWRTPSLDKCKDPLVIDLDQSRLTYVSQRCYCCGEKFSIRQTVYGIEQTATHLSAGDCVCHHCYERDVALATLDAMIIDQFSDKPVAKMLWVGTDGCHRVAALVNPVSPEDTDFDSCSCCGKVGDYDFHEILYRTVGDGGYVCSECYLRYKLTTSIPWGKGTVTCRAEVDMTSPTLFSKNPILENETDFEVRVSRDCDCCECDISGYLDTGRIGCPIVYEGGNLGYLCSHCAAVITGRITHEPVIGADEFLKAALNNVDVYKNIGAALDMDDIGLARRLTESLVPLPEESNLIIPSLDDEDIDHLSRTDFTYCIAQFGDDRYAEFEYPVERAEAMKILGRATPAKLFISNITFEDEIILKTLEIPCNIKQTGTDQYAEFESRESYQEACFQLGRF